MKSIQYSLDRIDQAAAQLLVDISNCSVITLIGSLGAGKTTLSAALLKKLGVQEPVISPTFTYVNVYKTIDGRTVYHFDLYRLKSIEEFEQIGFFEYLDQPNSLVLIEWPEIILPVLRGMVCHLQIESLDKDVRRITYEILDKDAV